MEGEQLEQDNLNIFVIIISVVGIFRKYLGGKIFLVFILAALAGFLDATGIMLVLPLLEEITNEQEKSVISSLFIAIFDFLGLVPNVASFLAAMIVIFIIKGVVFYSSLAHIAKFRGQLLINLKARLANEYKLMSSQYFLSKDAGYFSNLLNEQVNRSLQAFLAVCQLISHLANSIIYLSLAFFVTWSFGLMALVLGCSLLFLFRRINKKLASISKSNTHEATFLTSRLVGKMVVA